jgi:succinate-semialdehyde dehydrogenase/glutarate-semialdehyde dehydrogenase
MTASRAPAASLPETIPQHYLDSTDPATGDVIARFEITPAEAIPAVLERARLAQRDWVRVPVTERAKQFNRLHDVLFARRDELAEVVTRESGKPRVEALFADVLISIETAAYFARETPSLLKPERIAHSSLALKAKVGRLHYEPFGVMGVLSPWNYPLAIPFGQVIPAVAAGNAVVLKPSELTPWCGALVAEVFSQAGFPDGLVQIVQGGADTGAALVDPGASPVPCDKIFFTGSVATGRRVAEACARRLVPCVLELGGKDAMIVLADADLETATSAAVWGSLTNCGQACLSIERIYVEEKVAEKFLSLCVDKVKKLKLGSGLDPDVEIGPMISAAQVERVEVQLADAVGRGARVLQGGKRRKDLGPNYFEPTLVTDVNHSMALMREETFGPVLAVCAVRNAEEAVRLANDSPFALGASVWTRDPRVGKSIADRLEAGAVMVNDALSYFGICEAPHGGRRESGWGRTHGRHGFMEMVQVKYVDVDRLPGRPKTWWFGYDEKLSRAADHFVQMLHAPGWRERLRSARGALGAVFRGGRN